MTLGAETLADKATARAAEYYSDPERHTFFRTVWGDTDIHVGIYESPDSSILRATERTGEVMAEQAGDLGNKSHVIDLGSGYGGSARHLARAFGCRMDCLNLSPLQNRINREKTEAAGLSALIRVIEGNFEDIPANNATYDLIWSQDAFLHASNRSRLLDEITRILKPGGGLIFTDHMRNLTCPDDALRPILERFHLEDLASADAYRTELELRGVRQISFTPRMDDFSRHYRRIKAELSRQKDAVATLSGTSAVEDMLCGLDAWIEAAEKGHIAWGILHFRKD